MRDGLHGVFRRAKVGRLNVGGPDERARVILGGMREIDQHGRVSGERQRLACGFLRACEKHHVCVAQRLFIQSPNQRGLARMLGQDSGLFRIRGDQFQIDRKTALGDQVPQLAAHEGFAANQRPVAYASQSDAPVFPAPPECAAADGE